MQHSALVHCLSHFFACLILDAVLVLTCLYLEWQNEGFIAFRKFLLNNHFLHSYETCEQMVTFLTYYNLQWCDELNNFEIT